MSKKSATDVTLPAAPLKRDRNRMPNVALPEGVTMKPLQAGITPQGFLVRPTEDHPSPCTFVGILREVQQKKDPKDKKGEKMMVWGVFEALGDQPESFRYDRETGETSAIAGGDLVGVSRSGALHGMTADKKGHVFAIEYTGQRIKLDGGRSPMWEVVCAVSDQPYEG